jgi:HK97 family phage major capsid protein
MTAVYNSEITTSQLSAAMQNPEIVQEIFQMAINQSAALSLARRLPNMGTAQSRMSVMDLMPIAYFQATGTTVKQTTKPAWKGKTIVAEELAVIVPISENVLADSTNVDIWGETIPRIGEAMGKAVDAAIFHGTNLPATWLTDTGGTSKSILAGATAASMTEAAGTGLDLYDDIMGEDGIVALVDAQGFETNGFVGPVSTKGKLRHVRENRTDTGAGAPLLVPMTSAIGAREYMLGGERAYFPANGALDATAALLFCGDWNQIVYSIRQDITPKLLEQAVIQDGDGDIVFNLAQQDMVAMRFVFRLGFQIANPVTGLSATEATRYPFAVLTPAAT